MSGDGERRRRLLALLLGDRPGFETQRLCDVCADVVGVTGAGVMLMSGGVPHGSACATGAVSTRVEELQYDLGEGPCVDAYHQGAPVMEPDLAHPAVARWMAFSGPALAAGVRAVFGFPLQIGAVRLGALNLYNDRPGALSDEQHANATEMASITARVLLLLQAGAPAGALAAELEANADFRYVVHQAAGMIAAQLDVTVGDAHVRLRADAYGNGRSVTDVARDVVARRVRFDGPDGERRPPP